MGTQIPEPQRLSFQDACEHVRAGEALDAVVPGFVAGLTLDEKLACLGGDEDFWPGLRRMAGARVARVAGEAVA